MFLFLLGSFPLYLCLIFFGSQRVCLARLAQQVFFGAFSYIPVYLLSRLIPAPHYFPWNIFSVALNQLFTSREAFFRLVAMLLLLGLILRRYGQRSWFGSIAIGTDELLCWLAGYFMAQNIHDFLLQGAFPGPQALLFLPLVRLLFAQFLALGLEFLQVVRQPDGAEQVIPQAILSCCVYLLMAFVGLSAVSAIVIILNAYWIAGFALLLVLLIFWAYPLLVKGLLQRILP